MAAQVLRECNRSRVPFRAEIKDLVEAVRLIGGGCSGMVFLDEYCFFLKQLQFQRVVPGPLLRAIASLETGIQMTPLFKWALIKASSLHMFCHMLF